MDRNKKGWPWPGVWKVVCDVCQMQYPSDKVRKRWDGLMVCEHDWETRHPQDMYHYRNHVSVPDFVRTEPAQDTFIHYCAIEDQSCYSGLATSGCARSGNIAFSFEFLRTIKTDGHIHL